ncbi:glycosyltransferase family 2 protein [Agarivorans gilvus]|uniref:Glycosyltransferase 2-like domain-containing protein n=1 Tax=Agarivorans gilvus TaxID=680279 RepID=A0ABQ1I4U4_9ALTE|nr:glycosyltransferase [Agarivorans gilvus]GGB12359.1 hypothetical protein GCM10007414_27180 [Agarivorans gilvus]
MSYLASEHVQLSLIIPLYNAKEYILELADSLTQQLQDKAVEIIFVNDGSTDKGHELLETHFPEYFKTSQFKLLNQVNQGVSVARNIGIKTAKGAYIGFIDADDKVLEDYLPTIMDAIETKQPDIIEFGFKFLKNGKIQNDDIFVHQQFGLMPLSSVINTIMLRSIWYPWLRVFKRNLLCENFFPAGVRFCEDMMVIPTAYQKAQSIYHINQAIYAYRLNESGATLNVKPDYLEHLVAFYCSIPKSKSYSNTLYKSGVFYAIYRCALELGDSFRIPLKIILDANLIGLRLLTESRLGMRRKLILLLPYPFMFFQRLKGKVDADRV